MRHHTNATRSGYLKLAVSAVLGGAVAIALAGCHVDPVESSSGGGSVTAANSNNTPKPSTGSIRPTPAPTPTQTPTTAANTATVSCSGFPSGIGQIWKHHSEGDGNLVVLIPSFQAESSGAAVLDRTGRLIEQGRFVGRTNGNRPTYRFSRPGAAYPSPAILRVGSANYCIPVTGRRYD